MVCQIIWGPRVGVSTHKIENRHIWMPIFQGHHICLLYCSKIMWRRFSYLFLLYGPRFLPVLVWTSSSFFGTASIWAFFLSDQRILFLVYSKLSKPLEVLLRSLGFLLKLFIDPLGSLYKLKLNFPDWHSGQALQRRLQSPSFSFLRISLKYLKKSYFEAIYSSMSASSLTSVSPGFSKYSLLNFYFNSLRRWKFGLSVINISFICFML